MTKNLTKFTIITVMLMLVGFTSMAQQKPFGDAGGVNPFGGPTDTGPILYDQMYSAGTGYLNSSEYTDAANLTKTSETADDFDIPAGETWTIGKAAWNGYYGWGALGGATNINVRIYADDNGMPGTELHAFVNVMPSYSEEVNTGTIATYMEYTFSPAITLTDGKYWISFQTIVDYPSNGDWGWADAQNNPWIGEKLHWRNPLDGWGWGATTWTPGDLVMWFGYFDRAFALYEPSFNDDLAATALTSPSSAPGLTTTETIMMEIKNEGSDPQTGFDVSYSINGGTPVVENVGALSINPEDYAIYTFTTPADLSATGIYDIEVSTLLSGDQYTGNDATVGQVVNYGTIHVMTDGVDITTCEGTFTDPGGLYNNFNQNDVATTTIYPGTAGHMVRLNFVAFDVTWSDFYIYDGTTVNDPVLGYWQDDDNPGVITALNTTGALTIYFEAPGWDDAFGWEALITCYEKPDDDFAITEFIKSTSLVYTNLAFDFTATVRNLGAIAQSKDVTFYVDGMAIGTVNTGVVNPTEFATVTFSHTMSYDGNIHAEVTIPTDQGDDPSNDNAEMFFDAYIIDTFVEFFEQETFPPDYWSVAPLSTWVWQTTSGFPYDNSIGCAQSWVPYAGYDTLVTPQLIISNGDYISLLAKTSLWWNSDMKIIWKDANTGVWSELAEFAPTINYEYFEADISAAAGSNYLGIVNFCNDPWSWGGELTIDNVIGSSLLYFVDEDLKASNLQGTATPAVNTPEAYDIDIKNVGNNLVSYNTYQVKLMQKDPAGDIELVSAPGGTLTHLQQYTHPLTYTFQSSGTYDIYGVVDYGPDMIAENDTTQVKTIYVQVSGTVEVEVGTKDDESYWIPFRTGSSYSLSQTIYPESMISQTGALTGMKYFYNNNNYSDINDVEVMVYIGTTTNTYMMSYVSPDEMTLVYHDTVDFVLGMHDWYLPFEVPVNYTGGNLIAYVYHFPQSGWSPVVNFAVSNVSDTLSAWSTSYYYINPAKPDSATTANKELLIPVTNFFMNTAGFGEITGTVFDENGMEFPGVDVTIDGTTVTSVTNQDGEYLINEILGGSQSLTASVFEYEDNSQPVTIQAGIVNYLDFTMTPKPRVDVFGTVVGNDDPQNFLEGAEVKLSGYAGFIDLTDENGEFVLPWVYGNETYTVTVSLNGFDTYVDNNVQVANGNVDLGTIVLVEQMNIPFSAFAVADIEEVNLNWNMPNTGYNEHFTYDVLGNNGYAAEPFEHVWLGNIYETTDRGTITSVSMFFWDYLTFSGEVTLDIIDSEGNIVMTSEPFETVDDDWVHLDIPDVFFDGTFYAMVHWENIDHTTDFLDSYDTDFGSHGPNFGYIMYPGDAPYLVSELVGKNVTFIMEVDAVIEDETKGGGRAIEGYNIYTGPLSDALNASSWTPLNSTPVSDTFYVDSEWPPAVADNYVWAIEAIYTTGSSVFSFSNPIVGSPPISVPEAFNADELMVYPNPARNVLYIENGANTTAIIYSITGQEMGQYRLDGQLNEINVSNFESGLYIIRIIGDNNEVSTQKFLKN